MTRHEWNPMNQYDKEERIMKKLLTLVLALAMIATMFAVPAVAEEGHFKFDPPITITAVRTNTNPATVKYPEGEDVTNNVWTRRYLDEWGINLEYKWVVDESQWNDRVNLMIASQDLPDVFQATPVQFQQLYEAGVLADQTEAFDKYISDYSRGIIFESGDAQYNSAMRDGKLMAFPWTGMPKESANFLAVRKDWMEKFGVADIATWDDLVAAMTTFKENVDGAYGMTDTSSLTNLMALASAFGAYAKIWIPGEDGKLVYSSVQPEMRDALLAFQQLYKDGLLDPEFGSKDSGKVKEALASGKLGVNVASFPSPLSQWQDLKNNNAEMEIAFYPLPTATDKPAKASHALGITAYWVATAGCEHPEAVTMMANTFMEVFYGTTSDEVYDEYTNDASGNEIWQNAFVRAYRGFKNLSGWQNLNGVINGTMTLDECTPEERGVYGRMEQYWAGDNSLWCWDRIYGVDASLSVIQYYLDNDLYVMDEFYGSTTESQLEYQAILEKMELETFTKIIQGEDISAFDDFVNQWYALGGQDITDEVNEWYAAK